MTYDRIWRWRRTRYGPLHPALEGRSGARCRIFVRARMSIGVEFEDGYRVVTMRYAVRKAEA